MPERKPVGHVHSLRPIYGQHHLQRHRPELEDALFSVGGGGQAAVRRLVRTSSAPHLTSERWRSDPTGDPNASAGTTSDQRAADHLERGHLPEPESRCHRPDPGRLHRMFATVRLPERGLHHRVAERARQLRLRRQRHRSVQLLRQELAQRDRLVLFQLGRVRPL